MAHEDSYLDSWFEDRTALPFGAPHVWEEDDLADYREEDETLEDDDWGYDNENDDSWDEYDDLDFILDYGSETW